MVVGMTLSSKEENGSNGAEKSHTFGGGQGSGETGSERLGDERRKLRELPPECLCFPWKVESSRGREVWGLKSCWGRGRHSYQEP